MGFSNDLGNQGDMIAKAGMVQSQVTDATRLRADHAHREADRWPSGGTAVRVLLLAIVVIVFIGWVLTALN